MAENASKSGVVLPSDSRWLTGGKRRLECVNARQDLLIHLDEAEAWRIDGLYVRPPNDQ